MVGCGSSRLCALGLAVCFVAFGALPTPATAQQCGQVRVLRQGLIFGGFASTPGMWPWHVALMHRESVTRTSYKCGGTIINKDTVLTAYHCVLDNQRPIASRRLIARAGVFDLEVGGSTVQDNRVFEVVTPPGASGRTFNDDIAILKMENQFIYDDYVQPACIRSVVQDIGELVGTYGTVVGWGWTEHSGTSATLRQAHIPVASTEDCLQSNRNLFSQVLTSKVFCAGSRNGTSSCNGDSGGGMFFKQGGYWFLRGLTSFSGVDAKQNGVCDSNGYVGYTDVAKYLTWLQQNDAQFEDPLAGVANTPTTSKPGTGVRKHGNTTLIRLSVNPQAKKFLQQQKGSVLLRVSLNGKSADSLFQ